jgi:ABC-type antimicrobial peptide transport system permease subunit
MKHVITALLGFLVGALLGFIMINAITGCQSWDEEHWTEYSSCITPAMIWDVM